MININNTNDNTERKIVKKAETTNDKENKKIQQTQEPQQSTSNIYNVENMTVNNFN